MAGYRNGFNNLNFQTHQYADPSLALQHSLGAGGMFAQTLKSIQDYDNDQFRINKMQQEEHDKALNLGALEAANNRQVVTDYGNDMAAKLAGTSNKQGGTNLDYLIQKKDSELGIKNAPTYADIWKGVDPSKLSKEDADLMQSHLAADGQKSDYTAGNKLDVMKRLNMQYKGMSSDDALKDAYTRLGISKEAASGLMSAADEDLAFNQKVLDNENNPLFMETKSQALTRYAKEHGSTLGIQTSIDQAREADAAAAKEKIAQINELRAKAATVADAAERDALNRQADILKLQADSLNSPIARMSMKAETHGSGASNKNYEGDVNKITSAYLNKYNAAPQEIRDSISRLSTELQGRGLTPSQIERALSESVQVSKGTGKDPDVYTFKTGSYATAKPNVEEYNMLYGDKGGYASMANTYAAVNAERNKLLGQQMALLAKGGAKNEQAAAEIDKRIAELGRSKIESAHDAGALLGDEFMREQNLGGYGTQSKNIENRIAKTLSVGAPQAGINSGSNAAFTPSTKINGAYIPKGSNVYDAAYDLISNREGGSEFKAYMDYHQKGNKKEYNRPAIGGGYAIADINASFRSQGIPEIKTTKPVAGKDGVPQISIVGTLTQAQKNGIMEFKRNFLINEVNAANNGLSQYGVDTKNPAYANLVAGVSSMMHQTGQGANSQFVMKNIGPRIAAGDYQGAINALSDSWYASSPATKERAKDLVQGIVSYAQAQDPNVRLDMNKFNSSHISKAMQNKLNSGQFKTFNQQEMDLFRTANALQTTQQVGGSNGITGNIVTPNDKMIQLLHDKSYNLSPTRDQLVTPQYAHSGLSVPVVQANAENAVSDFNRYKEMHQTQYDLRQKQLEQDGKSDMQLSLIKNADMDDAWRAAKSPKERLAIIAAAQRKMSEQSSLQQSLLGF